MIERHDPSVVGMSGNSPILGVILAGGLSRRYGSDKAQACLGGVPLLQWVVERLRPQVDALALSGETRPDFALPIIPDRIADAGPLAALCSILAWAEERQFPLVATLPCDTPFPPRNMVAILRTALGDAADCAVAHRAGAAHPTCALWRIAARGRIEASFEAGTRSLHGAIAAINGAAADFSAAQQGPGGDPFFNINSQQDMRVAQAWLDENRYSP